MSIKKQPPSAQAACLSTGGASALPWGSPHQCRAVNFTAPSKSILLNCGSTNWWPNIYIPPKPHPFPGYVTCISRSQPHGFSNASFLRSCTPEGGCFVVGMTTTSTDTKSTNVDTDPGTTAAPLSLPACSIPQRCAGTGRAAGYLHSLKPSLKS